MVFYRHNIHFRYLSSDSSRTADRCRPEKTFLLVAAFTVSLMMICGGGSGAEVQHAGELGQIVASDPTPYHLTGGAWSILDLSVPQSGYAFAQVHDSTPPTFDSSELDLDAGVLTITFSETINTTNIVPTKIHIRETGNYTHGTTLSAGELDTDADGATISFNLTAPHLAAVAGLTAPELTIEPGAVWDEYGNLIVSTFDASTRMFVNATSISDQEDAPTGMAFSSDGTKMFVIGHTGNVNEYDLSPPFDASTKTFVNATSISDQEDAPTGMAFSSDGTKMFVIGHTGNVNEYDLSPPFDASTKTFVNATSISSQETTPTGIAFSNDGAKMFVIGSNEDRVNEYDLSPPL